MKKIIEGVRYDTEKAILIGEYDNLCAGVDSVTDFGYWEAGLYVTPKAGRYFLAGEGGAQTQFSRSIGQNSWSGGEGIIPMTKAEALAWAERYLDEDVVEEHFADMLVDA